MSCVSTNHIFSLLHCEKSKLDNIVWDIETNSKTKGDKTELDDTYRALKNWQNEINDLLKKIE